jgi:hypothetical protein
MASLSNMPFVHRHVRQKKANPSIAIFGVMSIKPPFHFGSDNRGWSNPSFSIVARISSQREK